MSPLRGFIVIAAILELAKLEKSDICGIVAAEIIDDMEIKDDLFICAKCKHFCANTNYETHFGCRAFPDGIPEDVGLPHSHDKVIKGQTGDFIYTPI